jgi:hypothetical protein
MGQAKKHAGGCHCGAVRFEVDVDLEPPVSQCNCSLCIRRGVTTTIVKPDAFRLVAGEGQLGDYRWGPKTTHFHFCKQCGIQTFARGDIPEIGGAYVSVNVNCLDDIDPTTLEVVHWDGRHNNWQAGTRATPWPIA